MEPLSRRQILELLGAADGTDRFADYYEALEARHLAELTFAEVRRALQALSSVYVERRGRMAEGAVFDGAGKRAAFALYYGPLHFLLVREVVRALGPELGAPRRILDLGCGTGAAGAAWALECEPRARVEGVDRSGWAVAESRWTLARLGLDGRATRGDAATAPLPGPPAGVLAAFTVNELAEEPRRRLLARLVEAARAGPTVLVVEPISRRVSPWWPEWAEAVRTAGGREDEWRFRPELPDRLALLGKAAGLDCRELTGRSLVLAGEPGLALLPAL
jgi:SAM-dependent methyltransferase